MSDHVHDLWAKALARRLEDPEGAITAARSLLESVAKHILDDLSIEYSAKADLPALYRAVATALNLAPSQHTEEPFKVILGGCTSVVQGLANLRNVHGDAHGQGRRSFRPAARHAELAVNLAGALATFMIATHEARRSAVPKS
ncbi:MAG: abortive infection family protein [Myxococcaceae bacterium]|nr:abortive infection family protein [Myxococcaceae bacterium]